MLKTNARLQNIFFLIVIFYILKISEANSQLQTDSLLMVLHTQSIDTIKIQTLIKLSSQISLSKDSSLEFANQSVKIAEKIRMNEWIARSQVALGLWYLNVGKNTDTAIVIWHRLYELMEKEKFTRGMAMACRFLGKAFLFHTADSAIYYNIKGIELFQQLNDTGTVNSIKINLAVVYAQSRREAEGIKLSKEGMGYADRNNILTDAGTAAVNVGYFYEWIGNLDSAAVYFSKSTEYNRRRGDPVGMGHGKSKLADILFQKKHYDEATVIYNELIESGKNINSDRLLNYGYNGLAALAMEQKKWDVAILHFNEGYSFSGKSNTEQIKYFESLYKAYSEKNDFKKALDYHVLFITARDTFNNAQRLLKVDELEAKFQNKEKQNQIEILNKEKEIQNASVLRQQLIRNVIIIIGIILLAFAGLIFNRFKLKKKIETQQALLNERIRISRELHDDLGAQLSTAKMFLNNLRDNNESVNHKRLVETSLNLIDGSINDLRNIMDDLHFSSLQEKGYLFATEELVNKINDLQQINFTLTQSGLINRLDPKIEHNLFRITQELINNTLKYANASKVTLDVLQRNGSVILMYEDNGIGFDSANIQNGYGLQNISSRTQSLGGSYLPDTNPGLGFRCTIEIPTTFQQERSL